MAVLVPGSSLPGEDRSAGGALFVDLIPAGSWFRNVRSAVAPSDWDVLRRHVYARAGYKCEACGQSARLDAHERFEYDKETGIQRLVRIIALCQACHAATHIGFALTQGRGDEAAAHLAFVRGWSDEEVEAHMNEAFDIWEGRNEIEWTVDLTIIEAAGFRIQRV